MKKIVLILPTYNERENIVTLIEAIEKIIKPLKNYQFELLVVDDESPDDTAIVVKKLMSKYKNLSQISKKKEGLGAAYLFGIRYAIKKFKPDFFIQIDTDWQHEPSLIPAVVAKIESGVDLVIGSRYVKGGSIPSNWGLHRKIYSVLGNAIVRFGLGKLSPHDWTSGYRMYKREVFESVQTGLDKYSGYTFQVAFLHKALLRGYKAGEVPLQFADRVYGRSKIAPFDYIKNLLLYILNNSTLLKYVVIGGVGFTVQTVLSKIFVMVGLFPGLAVLVGSFGAIVTNFFGNNFWTFSHKKIIGFNNYIKKFLHFCFTSIGALVIQVVVVSIGVFFLGKNAWFLLMVLAIIFLVIPYNYFIYNRFIWKGEKINS